MTEQKKFDWGKFDKGLNLDELQKDVEAAAENDFGEFPTIPDGKYEVGVEKLELTQSKKGDPMLSIWFTILDGEHKGNKLFYNKVMQPQNPNAWGIQVHQNNDFLRSLWDADKDEVTFKNFEQYGDLIMDIAEDVMADGDEWEYMLEKSTNDKGYDVFEILEIFEVE